MADDLPLLEWLRRRIWPLEGAHDERSLAASARLGLAEMLLAGTTTILDMGTVHHHDVVFEAMRDAGVRGFSGKTMMDAGTGVPKSLHETTRASLRESERLCDAWNGAENGRLGYAFAPRFILSCSEKLMRDTAELAREKNARTHSHVAEHADERAAVREVLGMDDVEALASYGLRGERCVLAHGVQLRKDEMRRLAKDRTRITHCPSANLKLASGIADVVAMREVGIVVALGADGAPCNNRMDPWTELRLAALLAKTKRNHAAALPAMAALELATIEGARALGIDAEVGSIEAGKRADLTVVRLDAMHSEPPTDVVGTLVYSCTAADVAHVVIDGRVVVKGGELVTLDEERVRADARVAAARIAT
jgi:cytosine/adenosine deaminase-related metal-dependent hydrolase